MKEFVLMILEACPPRSLWFQSSDARTTAQAKPLCIISSSSFVSSLKLPRSRSSKFFLLPSRVSLLSTIHRDQFYANYTQLAELHDEKHQPDIQNGSLIGMPLNEFTDEAISGLEKGLEEIPVGQAKQSYDAIEPQRQAAFRGIIENMKGAEPN